MVTKRRWARQGHMLTGRCTCNADEAAVLFQQHYCSMRLVQLYVPAPCFDRMVEISNSAADGVLGWFVRSGPGRRMRLVG
jgi:hypothetical protein